MSGVGSLGITQGGAERSASVAELTGGEGVSATQEHYVFSLLMLAAASREEMRKRDASVSENN